MPLQTDCPLGPQSTAIKCAAKKEKGAEPCPEESRLTHVQRGEGYATAAVAIAVAPPSSTEHHIPQSLPLAKPRRYSPRMIGRFVNLPFKVLGTVARAVQERDKAQWEKKNNEGEADDGTQGRISLDVPEDFDPGPIRIQAKKAVAGDSIIVDIGTDAQWAESHPAGAMHIPTNEIDIRLAELPPAVRIVVVGRESKDSERVVRFLRHRGLDETWSLHGGIEAWARAGGSIERG